MQPKKKIFNKLKSREEYISSEIRRKARDFFLHKKLLQNIYYPLRHSVLHVNEKTTCYLNCQLTRFIAENTFLCYRFFIIYGCHIWQRISRNSTRCLSICTEYRHCSFTFRGKCRYTIMSERNRIVLLSIA